MSWAGDEYVHLRRLKAWSQKESNNLTENQVRALETAKQEKEAHGELKLFHPGFLLGHEIFYVGWIMGLGEIYQQTYDFDCI